MKKIAKVNVFLVIAATLLSASWANAAGGGNNTVVLLAGTGIAYNGNELFEQFGLEPLDATCFDMSLIDAKTGNEIGYGSDCLSGIQPDGSGLKLTATSFFHFPGGSLVSRGLVTVQPKLHGLDGYTHVTGAAPSPGENNVIYGDGKFQNAAGSVRLSGLVNMSMLATEGIINFDCMFIIDIWN